MSQWKLPQPQEVRGWADRLRLRPQYAPDANRLMVIADEIAAGTPTPPPPPPPSLDPRIRFRNFSLQQFFGITSLTQQSGGDWHPEYRWNGHLALPFYPRTIFDASNNVTEAYVVAVEFIAPAAGYRGYFDRSSAGQVAPAEITQNKGVFTSNCRTGSLSWSTVPNEPIASYTKLVPGQRYWLQSINVLREPLISGDLQPIVDRDGNPQEYGVVSWQNEILLRPPVVNRIAAALKSLVTG